MLPNNKLFVVWVLDGIGLCEDVIRWGVLEWLVDWEKFLVREFGECWREKDLNESFIWFCCNGHLDIVKWLWKVSDGSINIHTEDERAFQVSCWHDHLDVVKWLWKVSNGSIDIHSKNEIGLRMSCWRGSLNVVKWLWKISNGSIDIHAENDYAFRFSCREGHLNVVKWLWKMSNGSIDREVINRLIRNWKIDKHIVDYLGEIGR